jgi:hypothetical protein
MGLPGIIAIVATGVAGMVKGCSSTKAPIRPPRPRWEDVFSAYPKEDDECFFRKYFGYTGLTENGQIKYDNVIIESGAARVSIALIKSGMRDVFLRAGNGISVTIPNIVKDKELHGCKIIVAAKELKNFLWKDAKWKDAEVVIEEKSKSWQNLHNGLGKSDNPRNGLCIILGSCKNHASLWIGAEKNVIDLNMNDYTVANFNKNMYTSEIYFWELKYRLPDTCWILSTGDKVYWYSGNYGDKTKLMYVFNASSGNTLDRSVLSQRMIDKGPTVEGDYVIDIKPEPQPAIIKIVGKDSYGRNRFDLERNTKAGIERIISNPPVYNFENSWGHNRVRLIPTLETALKITSFGRNKDTFYLHDSEKGYTSGCTDVSSRFFNVLEEYRTKMKENDEIKVKVMVRYPENHTIVCE